MRKRIALFAGIFFIFMLLNFSLVAFAQSILLTEPEVKEDDAAVRVLFLTSKTIPVECYDLVTPPQIIVDFMGEIYTNQPEVNIINKGVVKQMRIIKGTKQAADLDSSYYSVDFIIVDLKEPMRYDFSQGLNTAVLVVAKPGKIVTAALPKEEKKLPEPKPIPTVEEKKPELIQQQPVIKEEPKVKPLGLEQKEYEMPAIARTTAEKPKAEKIKAKPRPKEKKSLLGKLSAGVKKILPFKKKKEKIQEEKKTEKRRTVHKREKKEIEPREKKKVAAKPRKAVSGNIAEKNLEIVQRKKQEKAKEAERLNQELNTAKADLEKAKEELAKISGQTKSIQEDKEKAKKEFEDILKQAEMTKNLANAAWVDYTGAKEQLSEFLNRQEKEEVIVAIQNKYDQAKAALEKAIAEVEQAKGKSSEKLTAYNESVAKYDDLMAMHDKPQQKLELAQTDFEDIKEELKIAQQELMLAEQELIQEEREFKKHELERKDRELQKSLEELGIGVRQVEPGRPVIKEVKKEEEKKVKPKRRKTKEITKIKEEKKPKIELAEEEIKSAVELRNAGLEMQKAGDFYSAMKYYQQAMIADSDYATVHNDLGILYEQKGLDDKAKIEYLNALKIDPQYARAHTNLALLYEKLGDYNKAYYHWKQRVQLGKPEDPWTQKSKEKVEEYEQRK